MMAQTFDRHKHQVITGESVAGSICGVIKVALQFALAAGIQTVARPFSEQNGDDRRPRERPDIAASHRAAPQAYAVRRTPVE
jgi:hypothetical protein